MVSSPLVQLIRRSFGDPVGRDATDRELLRRFLAERDAAAFETIVRRHGPMVHDVCRAVLGNEADAEDAFQATFLVLARTAGSIRKAGSLGAWLHGVARRTALKARAESTRRRVTAAPVPERGAVDADDLSWRELRQVLHEELDALPGRVRGPLVLCYLEGMTHDRAATRLGLSRGTLRRRLERGRAALRERLARRGLGAALVLAAAWPGVAAAGLRRDVVSALINAVTGGGVPPGVATLTEGVLRTMYLTKLKAIGAAVLVCSTLALTGIAVHAALAREGAAGAVGWEPAPQAAAAPEARESRATWKVRATLAGHPDEVVCLAFGPGRLATAGKDGSVKVWDTATGKEKRALTYPAEGGTMAAMAFTPDGTGLLVAFGDQQALWSVAGQDGARPTGGNPGALPLPGTLSVDGLWVLRRDAEKRWAWERPDPARLKLNMAVMVTDPGFAARAVLRRAAAVPAMAVSPSGATLAVGGAGGPLTLWDARTRKVRATCEGHANDLLAAEFSPDGKILASAGADGTVRLWDAATGKAQATLKGHDGPVRSVAFSPDGMALATGGDDATVAVWDVAAKRRMVLTGHTGAVLAVAFRRDGRLLASAGKDKTVRLWEPNQRWELNRLRQLNQAEQPDALQKRIEQYEWAFRAQAEWAGRHAAQGQAANAKPIQMLVTLEKVTVERRNGESRSISASQTTLGAENPLFQPLKFENLAVVEDARITENGRAIRFADLKPQTVVRIELEARPGTFVVVGIEKVGTVK
jgi:RNA polymerase sigma factor (sigma-70 family)